jgi:hypothetical protein
VRASAVTACYSRHDDVLRDGFPAGEALSGGGVRATALGLVGPSAASRSVDAADVSASVPGPNPNQYLLSTTVMGHVDTLAADPSARPGEEWLGDMSEDLDSDDDGIGGEGA